MAVKFVALWNKPEDVEGFEAHYLGRHREIVARWPGVQSVSITRLGPPPGGGDAPYHILFEAVLASPEDLRALLRSEPLGEAVQDAQEMAKLYGTGFTVLTGEIVSET